MESQCLVNIKKFIKIDNHFGHFWNFYCYWYTITYIVFAKMCLDITSYEIKEHTFFGILFFCV
jgi:hypothetical protein